MNEADLIRRINEGDEAAFEIVFRKHFTKLCLYAEHYVRQKHVAREIVEDFFCDLWMKSPGLSIESNLTGYFFRSIHNRCLKFLRHEKVKQDYLESRKYIFTDQELLEPVSDEYPEASLISRELENEIVNAIDSLPEQCRKVFSMNRFDNLTYMEIAEKMGISVNTVKTQMTRALQKLRNNLRNYLIGY